MQHNTTQARNAPHLDPERLLELKTELSPTQFRDLVRIFLQDIPEVLVDLHAAHSGGDAQETRELAHRLKGGASTFGAVRMTQLFQDIQMRADEGDLETAGPLLLEVEQEFLQVQNLLQNQVQP